VSPAFTIISISISSKYPWKRPVGPVSVPIAMGTPASDSFFRFRFATSSATLYCCADLLARIACWRAGSWSVATHSAFACARKNESAKKSGVDSYTNVETSRMSVGL
jgi:hypothetical protein